MKIENKAYFITIMFIHNVDIKTVLFSNSIEERGSLMVSFLGDYVGIGGECH